MSKFFCVITIIGSLIGGVILIAALSEDSAPKQAAAAGIAIAFAVIPYCIARASGELSASHQDAVAELRALNEKSEAHSRLLAAVANAATASTVGTGPAVAASGGVN